VLMGWSAERIAKKLHRTSRAIKYALSTPEFRLRSWGWRARGGNRWHALAGGSAAQHSPADVRAVGPGAASGRPAAPATRCGTEDRRSVDFPPRLADALATWQATCEAEALVKNRAPSICVFLSRTGQPWV
jgi:hypothetical protein